MSKYEKKKKRGPKKKIDDDSAGDPGQESSPGMSIAPHSGREPPSSSQSPKGGPLQLLARVPASKGLGEGDKDGIRDARTAEWSGEEDSGDDGDGPGFFGDDQDGGFDPERLRPILPGLIGMGFRMGAKRVISHADAVLLSDQIIDCAMSDEGFADVLSVIPSNCFLTVGISAFMIYLRSEKDESEHNAPGVTPGRSGDPGGLNIGAETSSGSFFGSGREASGYQYDPKHPSQQGYSGHDIWGDS